MALKRHLDRSVGNRSCLSGFLFIQIICLVLLVMVLSGLDVIVLKFNLYFYQNLFDKKGGEDGN